MKEPKSVTPDELLSEPLALDAIIDARSEGEFSEDRLPGFENRGLGQRGGRIGTAVCRKQRFQAGLSLRAGGASSAWWVRIPHAWELIL